MSKAFDLTGKRFGKWIVIERKENYKRGSAMWLCRCECGKEVILQASHLVNGHTSQCRSCAKTTHGRTASRLYQIHNNMMRRCYSHAHKDYVNYGGRGISVCKEWHDPVAFMLWADKSGYGEKLTIDRIDNNENYEPSNCRWVNWFEQENNRRDSHWITIGGLTKTIAQWARERGISVKTINTRVWRKWPVERLLQPIRVWRKDVANHVDG